MFERFTAPARQAVTKAVEQSRELGAHAIGSEHLLLGLLAQPHSAAAGILADLGVRPDDLRRAVRNGEFTDPDAQALESIGIDLEAVRRKVEEAFGPGALGRRRPARARWGWRRRRGSHMPFTPHAKQALELALREAIRLKHRWLGTEHILLGLLRLKDSTAARLLASREVDHAAAEEAVRRRPTGEARSG
jgi:ATP-dependent Clp protease ATP-binding subunit ClpA